jgi:Zn-dependent protease
MNLLLAFVAALLLAAMVALQPTGLLWLFIGQNLLNFLAINVFLAIFNMIPLPPFDGGHVVEGLLPAGLSRHYAKLNRFGLLLFIFLLLVVPMLFPNANIVERLIGPPARWLTHVLLPNSLG